MNAEIINTETLLNILDSKVKIIDCRYSLSDKDAGQAAYEGRRIPGSIYLDLERDLSANISNNTARHPLPNIVEWSKTISRNGLSDQVEIVIYDDGSCVYAARVWWMLAWAGIYNVRILEGGFNSWLKKNLPFSAGDNLEIIKSSNFSVEENKSMNVESQVVVESLNDSITTIIDAREPERFCGIKEPLDKVAGCIPGSINRYFKKNMHGGAFKSQNDLKREFRSIIKSDRSSDVIHTCGSGVTACLNLFAMEYAGLKGSRLYSGSWSEWILDSSRPVSIISKNK